jgi:hypothetical protein
MTSDLPQSQSASNTISNSTPQPIQRIADYSSSSSSEEEAGPQEEENDEEDELSMSNLRSRKCARCNISSIR